MKYAIDLAGALFGFFGTDPRRPQIICEPIKEYMTRFCSAVFALASFMYEAKVE